jgi:hypothetical protein
MEVEVQVDGQWVRGVTSCYTLASKLLSVSVAGRDGPPLQVAIDETRILQCLDAASEPLFNQMRDYLEMVAEHQAFRISEALIHDVVGPAAREVATTTFTELQLQARTQWVYEQILKGLIRGPAEEVYRREVVVRVGQVLERLKDAVCGRIDAMQRAQKESVARAAAATFAYAMPESFSADGVLQDRWPCRIVSGPLGTSFIFRSEDVTPLAQRVDLEDDGCEEGLADLLKRLGLAVEAAAVFGMFTAEEMDTVEDGASVVMAVTRVLRQLLQAAGQTVRSLKLVQSLEVAR